jgi:MFS family permease
MGDGCRLQDRWRCDGVVNKHKEPGLIQAFALLLPITMAVMGAVVLQPVQGLLSEHFALVPGNEYWVPFLLTVPAIAATCFTVVAGYLADVFGRRRVLLAAMAVYVAVGVGPYFMQDLIPIALCRIGVGLSEGVVLTVTTALLGDYFKGRMRDRLMGFQAAIASTSASLLIPLSGYLGSRIGWNGPFLIYAISIVWLLGILMFTWEPRPDENAGERAGGASWRGFPWGPTLKLCLVTLIGGYFFYTVQFEVPVILPAHGVKDPGTIGALMGLVSWGMVVGAVGFQFAVKRSTVVLLAAELSVIAASFVAMSRAPTTSILVSAAFVNQIGCGALLPTLLAACMRFLPFEHRGRGTGIWQGALASGQFVVAMSFPAITAATGGNRSHTLLLISIAAAVSAAIALVIALREIRTASVIVMPTPPCRPRM